MNTLTKIATATNVRVSNQ